MIPKTGSANKFVTHGIKLGCCTLNKPFSILDQDDLGFVYSGSFHDGLTARLIDLSETVLSRSNVSKGKRNKLAFAMVEAYQNIIRHKVALPFYEEHPSSRPAFVVRSNQDVQSLVAMNAVPNTVREKIEERIAHINAMSREELKKMFLLGLEDNAISEKGGAGLGLIEMARRSGNKLGCRMIPFAADHSLFCLAVVIGEVNDQKMQGILNSAQEFHEMSVSEDMLIMHKGELSASAVSALLPMVQRDMDTSPQKASVRSRAYLAGVEVFRSQAGQSDGIFALCRNAEDYIISVGQRLSSSIASTLQESVERVNSMNDEELDTNFRRALLSQDAKDKELRGLLDLAICSKDAIASETDAEDGDPFVSIQATI